MPIKAELVLDSKCLLGEGPYWDVESQKLYWIDGFGQRIFIFDPASGKNRAFQMDRHVGCAIPCRDGRILALLRDGLYHFAPGSGDLSRICLVEPDLDNNRPNDGKCDASGRLWFGTMSMTANQPEREFEVTGGFYKLEDGRPVQQLGGVGISNGIAWSGDNKTMYYVDSPTRCVFAFDFDLEKGGIDRRRVAVRLPEDSGVPDGMTIDEQDKLWVAHFGGGMVSRWDPATGRQLDCVLLPTTNVTSCCFGGPDLDILYITTAIKELSEEQKAREPLAGGLFQARPGVAGRALARFRNC